MGEVPLPRTCSRRATLSAAEYQPPKNLERCLNPPLEHADPDMLGLKERGPEMPEHSDLARIAHMVVL